MTTFIEEAIRRARVFVAAVCMGIALFVLPGCSSGESPARSSASSSGHEGHDHGPGESHDDHDGHDHGPGGHDDHEGHDHHEGGPIELTEEQYRSAEIEVVEVRSATVSDALTLPGSITPNADAVLHVTPRVSGQVREVYKQLGERAEAGELLCVIDSVELGDAVAAYLRGRAMVDAAEARVERERDLYAERMEALTRVLEGSIAVQDRIYERERELQSKAVSTVRPLLEAEKALELARLERDARRTELAAERDARFLELDVALRAERIELAAATNRLRTLGVDGDRLAKVGEGSPLLSGEYRVYAPGAGIVVDRHASTGEFVEAGSKLFIIEDLTNVWFVASAFEEQLAAVRSGQSAEVALDAFPEASLAGTVSFVDYHVDPKSRSVGVRITLENRSLSIWPEELPLRPGMFGRVRLATSSRAAALALPERALVHEDAGDYVFVQVAPRTFERRDVEVRHAAEDRVEIIAGLRAGERVAVGGTFLLKSAERRGELGGGHSH